MKNGAKVRQFLDALRAGPYTSVGCYPVFVLLTDGSTLSHSAALENVWEIARSTRDGYGCWEFEAADINWEEPELYCDQTGERIESAYAEPEPMPETFFEAFLECALWLSTDNANESGGGPLDDNYDTCDFTEEALASLRKDCENFWEANYALLQRTEADDEQNGHDFWLTRNGHGAGFWDRGYGEVGELLSKACKPYGSVYLYVHNGKVFAQ